MNMIAAATSYLEKLLQGTVVENLSDPPFK